MLTAVRVVLVDLGRPPSAVEALTATLATDERRGSPESQVARAALRDLLGEELGAAPESVEISRECARCGDPDHGKPFVVGADLSFSLSHSASVAVVALVRDSSQIGIDLEAVRDRVRLQDLAQRVCSPEQFDAWQALPVADQLPGFFRLWTAKEAYLKATGEGITTSLAAVPERPDGWFVGTVPGMPEGYVAALAIDRPEIEITAVEWRLNPSGGTEG